MYLWISWACNFRLLPNIGTVPAAVHKGKNLYESLPICFYLEEAFPDSKPLWPADPYLRFRGRILLDLVGGIVSTMYRYIM